MEIAPIYLIAAIIITALIYSLLSKEKTPPETTSSDLVKAQVRYIIDGDTVIVWSSRKEIRIRLSAIDCPEDGQPWGDTATAGLIKLIGGRDVYLETYGIDEYGRTLATIYVKRDSELVNVNERMVMLGHAWVMRQYYNHLSRSRRYQLDRLESWARSKRVGLWKLGRPIPPWLWRNRDWQRLASHSEIISN